MSHSPSSNAPSPERLAFRAGADRALEDDFSRGISGEAAAYRRFLDALLDLLRSYFRRRLTGAQDVEDLVQEAVLAIHDRRHTFSGQVPITAWIHAIARYKLMDWLRENALQRRERVELDEDASLVDDNQGAWEARHDLLHLLRTLPAKQQLAIVHVRIWGRSVREAALRMGVSESDVKISVHRGLLSLTQGVLGRARAP